MLRELLELSRSIFGPESRTVAFTGNHVAQVLFGIGKYEEARQLAIEAVEVATRLWGPDDINRLKFSYMVALYLRPLGDHQEAKRLHEQVDDGFNQTGDAHSIDRVQQSDNRGFQVLNLKTHAELLLEQGEYAEAERLLRRAETIIVQNKSMASQRGRVDFALGEVLHALGRDEEARQSYEQVYQWAENRLEAMGESGPPMHRFGVKTLAGGSLEGLGRYREAEPLLLASFEWLSENMGVKSPMAQDALTNLIQVYQGWGKPEKAVQYEAMKIPGQ